MPPAFVLSQDQTLHKHKFVYQKNLIKALLIRLTSHNEFSRFTSHYSIFNQLASVWGACCLIYHQFWFCQINFEDFFNFLSASHHQVFQPRTRCRLSEFGAFYNIDPISNLCKLFLKLFSKFFEQLSDCSNQLFACRVLSTRRKTRYNIASGFASVKQNFQISYNFLFSPVQLLNPWEANRDII